MMEILYDMAKTSIFKKWSYAPFILNERLDILWLNI